MDFNVYCYTIPKPPEIPPPPIDPLDLIPGAITTLLPGSFVRPLLLPISMTGQILISFDESIELIEDHQKLSQEVRVIQDGAKLKKSAMEITALPGEFSENSNLDLKWDVLEITDRYFHL